MKGIREACEDWAFDDHLTDALKRTKGKFCGFWQTEITAKSSQWYIIKTLFHCTAINYTGNYTIFPAVSYTY